MVRSGDGYGNESRIGTVSVTVAVADTGLVTVAEGDVIMVNGVHDPGRHLPDEPTNK